MRNEKLSREFKGIWMPREIYLAVDLTWIEKIFLVEIDSLSQTDKGCFASNEYFSEFLNVSVGHVVNMLTKFRQLGLIRDLGFDGRRRRIKMEADSIKKCTQRPFFDVPSVHENMDIIIKSNNLDKTSKDTPSGLEHEIAEKSSAGSEECREQKPEEVQRKKLSYASSVEEPVKKNIKKLSNEELQVLEVFKEKIWQQCNEKTASVLEGIPRALELFCNYHGKTKGLAKLLEALNMLPATELFQKQKEKSPWACTPKVLLSKTYIENYLLPLTIKQQSNGNLHTSPKSEAELREIEEANERELAKFMASRGK